jgi:hypothetical protein
MSVSRPRRILAFAVIALTAGAATVIGSFPGSGTAPTAAAPVTVVDPGAEAALAAREVRAVARLGLAEQRLRAVTAANAGSAD